MRGKLMKIAVFFVMVTVVLVLAAFMTMSVTGTQILAQTDNEGNLNAKSSETKGNITANTCVEAYNQHNLIRFHVIANSDSNWDQAMKRQVRDLIVREMTPEFEKARGLDDAREIARTHLEDIRIMAQKQVRSWGEEYPVRVQLGNYDFPVKTYGELTLPAGKYEAVRVIIGKGQGANWWCVLFPPLCFVDVSRSMGSVEQVTASKVYSVTYGVSPTPTIEAKPSSDEKVTALNYVEDEQEQVKIRFKIVELLEGIFG